MESAHRFNRDAPAYGGLRGVPAAQSSKQEETLPLARAAQITCGILDGISCAHHHGVLHLDIKPANIMINTEGQQTSHRNPHMAS